MAATTARTGFSLNQVLTCFSREPFLAPCGRLAAGLGLLVSAATCEHRRSAVRRDNASSGRRWHQCPEGGCCRQCHGSQWPSAGVLHTLSLVLALAVGVPTLDGLAAAALPAAVGCTASAAAGACSATAAAPAAAAALLPPSSPDGSGAVSESSATLATACLALAAACCSCRVRPAHWLHTSRTPTAGQAGMPAPRCKHAATDARRSAPCPARTPATHPQRPLPPLLQLLLPPLPAPLRIRLHLQLVLALQGLQLLGGGHLQGGSGASSTAQVGQHAAHVTTKNEPPHPLYLSNPMALQVQPSTAWAAATSALMPVSRHLVLLRAPWPATHLLGLDDLRQLKVVRRDAGQLHHVPGHLLLGPGRLGRRLGRGLWVGGCVRGGCVRGAPGWLACSTKGPPAETAACKWRHSL